MSQVITQEMWRKLVWWKAISGSLVLVAGSTPSLILNWTAMTPAVSAVAVMGIVLSVILNLIAFFDQTFARLAMGKTPVPLPGVPNGDTEHLTYTVTDATTTTTTTRGPQS